MKFSIPWSLPLLTKFASDVFDPNDKYRFDGVMLFYRKAWSPCIVAVATNGHHYISAFWPVPEKLKDKEITVFLPKNLLGHFPQKECPVLLKRINKAGKDGVKDWKIIFRTKNKLLKGVFCGTNHRFPVNDLWRIMSISVTPSRIPETVPTTVKELVEATNLVEKISNSEHPLDRLVAFPYIDTRLKQSVCLLGYNVTHPIAPYKVIRLRVCQNMNQR